MDERTGEVSGASPSTDEIRRDIARTQQEMGETIDEIQYRLSPDYMKQRAKAKMRRQVLRTRDGFIDKVRANPIGAAMVGVGLLLMLRDDDRDDGYASFEEFDADARYGNEYATRGGYYEDVGVAYQEQGRMSEMKDRVSGAMGDAVSGARDRVGGAMSDAGDRVGGAMSAARERMSSVAESAGNLAGRAAARVRTAGPASRDFVTESPLVAGLAAIAVGALLGALVPETDREDALFGETRDRLAGRAKELARSGVDHAKGVAGAAVSAATDAAKQEVKTAKEDIARDIQGGSELR